MRQIKQHRIKPEEINAKMKAEYSTTTMSERSPSHRAPGSAGKIKVEEQTQEGVPQMDFNYSQPSDPGRKRSNLHASRLDKMLASNPKSRPASRSNVRLAFSQSIYAAIDTPICINRKQSTGSRPFEIAPHSTGGAAIGTRKASIETDIRNIRLNQSSALEDVPDKESQNPVGVPSSRNTRTAMSQQRPSTFFRTIGREHRCKQNSLRRPDEGEYFSLTYQPSKNFNQTVYLDKEEEGVKQFVEANQSAAASRNERINFYATDNPENKHYHRDAKRQQDELIVKMALYKDIKKKKTNLARRNSLIHNRHSTGLIGSDSPEKEQVAKVFVKKGESLKRRKEGFDSVMQSRF